MRIFRGIKTIILPVALLLVTSATTVALAEEEKPTADLTVGFYSQYIWRGFALSKDSLVIQPSMTVSYKGFSTNLWGNLDTKQYDASGADETNNFNETDLTLSYDGSAGIIGYGVGYIYYALDGINDSQELYASVSVDTLLSPTLTIYKEITGIQGWYANFGISHTFSLTEKIGLDLGASVGYLDDEADYNAFHDGVLSAALSIPVSEYITIAPELKYSFALTNDAEDVIKALSVSDEDDSFIYGGVSMSLSF